MENLEKDEIIPLVSINCVTYNHIHFIRDTIEGFINQKTSFPFEILIYDDASTDGTVDIIREYAEKYPDLFHVIYQKENQYQKGISVARKYQYPRVRGKYIAFCEGDDYWTDPLKLEKQIRFLEFNPDFVFCFHAYQVLDQQGSLTTRKRWPQEKVIFQKDIMWQLCNQLCTSVFRIDAMPTHRGYTKNKNIHGDFVTTVHASGLGKGKYFPDVMAVYRKHAGGIASSLINSERYKKSLLSRIHVMHNQKLQFTSWIYGCFAIIKYGLGYLFWKLTGK